MAWQQFAMRDSTALGGSQPDLGATETSKLSDAWSKEQYAGVHLAVCTARRITFLGQDPDFNYGQSAVHHVKVLEIPTPRWSTRDIAALDEDTPGGLPTGVQERAYTPPIWYNP